MKLTKHHIGLVRNYTEYSKHKITITVSLLTRSANDAIPNALQFLLFNVLLLWKVVFNPFKYNKDQANHFNSKHQPKNVERSSLKTLQPNAAKSCRDPRPNKSAANKSQRCQEEKKWSERWVSPPHIDLFQSSTASLFQFTDKLA